MKANIYILFTLCVILSGCSRSLNYFTNNLYDEFNWTEADLKQIQFYVSDDIRLVRVSNSGVSNIENGQIKIQDERKVDQVIIKKGTPGTLLFAKGGDRFAVSFDKDPDKYLMFGPNEKASGRYVLLAKRWQKKAGIITYGDIEYRTNSDSAYAALMVDINNARKSISRSSTATGRKVN